MGVAEVPCEPPCYCQGCDSEEQCARAVVPAVAKRKVGGLGARDVQPIGARKLPGISIRGLQLEDRPIPGSDANSA